MSGRVKTLHPKVHGGILGRRGIDDKVMEEHGIKPIDLVVVNLYPFAQTVAKPDCTLEQAIENIDIGGPTMVRAAAKNHRDVGIVVRASDYDRVISEMDANNGSLTYETRFDLAVAAFEHTAQYDGMIANYFGRLVPQYGNSEEKEELPAALPRTFSMHFIKKQAMRYGENSHQKAAFYVEPGFSDHSVATAVQFQGKALSYNNISDTDAALECVKQFSDEPACVIVKHANPCGVALAPTLAEAYERAFATDKESAFGGIIAFNRELDGDTASRIIKNQFCEVIIAPKVSEEAKQAVSAKHNIRLLECGFWDSIRPSLEFKCVYGGLLVQERDTRVVKPEELKVVTKRQPSPAELQGTVSPDPVVPMYLISTYLVLTFAELLLSPMGISFVSKVAPPKVKGLMMGLWFASTAVGNYLSSIPGLLWKAVPLWANWAILMALCVIAGAIMFAMMKKINEATAS